MAQDPELFGDEAQTAVQRIIYHLWPLLNANPKLSNNGRTINYCNPGREEIPIILELARVFKRVGVIPTTDDMVERIRLAAVEENLEIAVGWQILCADRKAVEACKAIVAPGFPDGDYELLRVTNDTMGETVAEFQSVQEESGVAPVPGYVMRGNLNPSVCIAAMDSGDRVASTAFAIKTHHPESQYADWAHIGYLATRQELRGRGLSKHLLAQVIIDSFENIGADYVWTGVRPDNAPSRAVCVACGMVEADWTAFFVHEPAIVSRDFTR